MLENGLAGGASGEEPACQGRGVREQDSIPGSGRSPGGGNGNPLQYLAWETPGTEEPGGVQFMGSHRVGHN